jgi:hypothetical protein
MLQVPNNEERKARFVGTQVCKVEERWYRKSLAGSQCAGNEGLPRCRRERYCGMLS